MEQWKADNIMLKDQIISQQQEIQEMRAKILQLETSRKDMAASTPKPQEISVQAQATLTKEDVELMVRSDLKELLPALMKDSGPALTAVPAASATTNRPKEDKG